MRGVDIPHLNLCPALGQPTTECIQPALVGQFSQRISLLEKLRKTSGIKELVNRSLHGACRDQAANSVFLVQSVLGKLVACDTRHPHQPGPQRVLRQLAGKPDPFVRQVVLLIEARRVIRNLQKKFDRAHDVGEV